MRRYTQNFNLKPFNCFLYILIHHFTKEYLNLSISEQQQSKGAKRGLWNVMVGWKVVIGWNVLGGWDVIVCLMLCDALTGRHSYKGKYFWKKIGVICYVSCLICHVSHFTCLIFFSDKLTEIVF